MIHMIYQIHVWGRLAFLCRIIFLGQQPKTNNHIVLFAIILNLEPLPHITDKRTGT